MNNVVFRKIMENVINHRDLNFIASEAKRTYLVLESNYHRTKFIQTKFIQQSLSAIEIKRHKYL